jgi:hypothetical protein
LEGHALPENRSRRPGGTEEGHQEEEATVITDPQLLRTLPLRGMVAFAARCAERSRVHLASEPSYPSEGFPAAIEGAIRVATAFAGSETIPAEVAQAAAEAAEGWVVCRRGVHVDYQQLATAASAAARAVWEAVRAPAEGMADRVLKWAWVAGNAEWKGSEVVGLAARDLQSLQGQGLGTFPDLGAALDVSGQGPLGPLWPKGTPREQGQRVKDDLARKRREQAERN